MKRTPVCLMTALILLFVLPVLALAADDPITTISGLTDLIIGYDMMAGEDRGEKATLIAYTSDGTAQNVVWTSSNESVVTVSPEGVLWAKGVGETEVTASNDAGSMGVTVTVKRTCPSTRWSIVTSPRCWSWATPTA
ncbi:MAG: Ig-like domain-containing protein [Candidatus Ventricola sp.]